MGLVVVTGMKGCLIFDVKESQGCARQVVYRFNKASRRAVRHSDKVDAFCIMNELFLTTAKCYLSWAKLQSAMSRAVTGWGQR